MKKGILKKVDKVVELVGGGSVINGAYLVYFQTSEIHLYDTKLQPGDI